ncbi:NADH-quinone oxidoreductase subunit L [Buchnera aphidicola (Kurisakia onigurumii)]|uniref:NADH-quinone oxidoreductase subunit L n=1 Tax=Buchnera aphidicola TaxID=9 RepID=UPI0031B6DDC7
MNYIYLTILMPCISFFITFFNNSQKLFIKKLCSYLSVIFIFFAFLNSIYISIKFFYYPSHFFIYNLWNWIGINNSPIQFNFFIDKLSLIMLVMVTGIGFLIQLFSCWYMKKEKFQSRFFSLMSLFIVSMMLLVLADNLILIYLGWELVGLCSYLLISFYYKININCIAAKKAFLMTKIGDIFLFFSIIIIYNVFHTLSIHSLVTILNGSDSFFNSKILEVITLFLLIGSIAKSAQFPFQTWLSDAMVGPTPASALIHAATMVISGVYLISRTNFIFSLTPDILFLISCISCFTILISGLSALVQHDIKKILAYSTISQVGYMFLALGSQSWNAAIFHVVVHAIFKSLLFLSTSAVILKSNLEQNIFKMGGLRKKIPLVYISFIFGISSLLSLPIITAGFYSKESILISVLGNNFTIIFFVFSLLGVFLTSMYTSRLFLFVFYGKNFFKNKNFINYKIEFAYYFPLIILNMLSTFILILIFNKNNVFPINYFYLNHKKIIFELISFLISSSGCLCSYYIWNIDKNNFIKKQYIKNFFYFIVNFLLKGWYFDKLYNLIFIFPHNFILRLINKDPIDKKLNLLKYNFQYLNKFMIEIEFSYLRKYFLIFILSIIIFLSVCIITIII